jgi:hypothetical protein
MYYSGGRLSDCFKSPDSSKSNGKILLLSLLVNCYGRDAKWTVNYLIINISHFFFRLGISFCLFKIIVFFFIYYVSSLLALLLSSDGVIAFVTSRNLWLGLMVQTNISASSGSLSANLVEAPQILQGFSPSSVLKLIETVCPYWIKV